MKTLIVHPEAEEEGNHEEEYYEERREGLGEEFRDILQNALSRIEQNPKRYTRRIGPCQRLYLDRFPFSIVFEELEQSIFVYAIMHNKRRPFYWLHRRIPHE